MHPAPCCCCARRKRRSNVIDPETEMCEWGHTYRTVSALKVSFRGGQPPFLYWTDLPRPLRAIRWLLQSIRLSLWRSLAPFASFVTNKSGCRCKVRRSVICDRYYLKVLPAESAPHHHGREEASSLAKASLSTALNHVRRPSFLSENVYLFASGVLGSLGPE